jgi:polyvinyl alcohol dehydrogenase (cytochrome)
MALQSRHLDTGLRPGASRRILWDVDSVKSSATINGAQSKGGSLDGAGPVIVGGMMFVTSGYPRLGGMPGNVVLAFGVDGGAGEPRR